MYRGSMGSYEKTGTNELSDLVRNKVKLEIPWRSTSTAKEFGRVFTNASHLRRLSQYELQQRIIKEQDGEIASVGECQSKSNVGWWNGGEMGGGYFQETTDWRVKKDMGPES